MHLPRRAWECGFHLVGVAAMSLQLVHGACALARLCAVLFVRAALCGACALLV